MIVPAAARNSGQISLDNALERDCPDSGIGGAPYPQYYPQKLPGGFPGNDVRPGTTILKVA